MLITIPNVFSAGAVIVASQHNSNFSTIANSINGGLDNTNLTGSAGITYANLNITGSVVAADLVGSIPDSKLNQITTASKVSGAAITLLTSLPSGAGVVPTANLGSGTANSTTVLYGDQTYKTPPTITAYAAGTFLETYSMQLAQSTISSTPNKVKELSPMVRAGVVSVKFDYASSTNAGTHARIYVNGSAVGTDRTDSTGSYTTYTESITVAVGDLIQIYGAGDSGSTKANIANMKVLVTVPTVPQDETNLLGKVYLGSGVPSTQTGDFGDLYIRTDGSTSTTLYVKTGASTWTAK